MQGEEAQGPEISVTLPASNQPLNVYTLQAAEYNPREISPQDFKMLKNSIKKFGDLSGVVRNIQTNNLVGGHQRIAAFKEMQNPTIVVEETLPAANSVGTVARGYVLLGDEKYTYREVDWPLQKEMQANLAANRIQGKFVQDKLAVMMADIEADLREDTGFTTKQIDKLLDEVGALGDTPPPMFAADLFIVPPISVLDTQAGYWLERMRGWHKLMGDEPREGELDPVTFEVALRWFAPKAGIINMPFGDHATSTFVAEHLGHIFSPVASDIVFGYLPKIEPGSVATILDSLKTAITALADNRFVVLFVGEDRMPNGQLRGNASFLSHELDAAGVEPINDLILVNGIKASKAGGIMPGRQVAQAHDRMLVFYKGDPSQIEANFGPMQADMPAGLEPTNWQATTT